MTIPIYHKSWQDNELADFYMVNGINAYAQINAESVSKIGKPGSGQLAVFDEDVWKERRYTPHRKMDEGKGCAGNDDCADPGTCESVWRIIYSSGGASWRPM